MMDLSGSVFCFFVLVAVVAAVIFWILQYTFKKIYEWFKMIKDLSIEIEKNREHIEKIEGKIEELTK